MQTTSQIAPEQWLVLANLIEEQLQKRADLSKPLELSYDLVKELLGFTGEIDFYMALWHFHQEREPPATFWFHGNHRPGQLPQSLLFYPRNPR